MGQDRMRGRMDTGQNRQGAQDGHETDTGQDRTDMDQDRHGTDMGQDRTDTGQDGPGQGTGHRTGRTRDWDGHGGRTGQRTGAGRAAGTQVSSDLGPPRAPSRVGLVPRPRLLPASLPRATVEARAPPVHGGDSRASRALAPLETHPITVLLPHFLSQRS